MINRIGELLRQVGDELLALRGTGIEDGKWYGTQLKTEADILAHKMICTGLARLTPDLPVISEEDESSHARTRPTRYWLIDPIDGTASYAGGYDGWVSQIALMADGVPVLGAVYAPAFRHLFLAESGAGATRNGERLNVSEDLKCDTLIDNYPEPRGTAHDLFSAFGMSTYRESGSIGLKACRIADATADVFFKDVTLRDWDIAPADIIVSEAGGVVRSLTDTPFPYEGPFKKPGVVVATHSKLASQVADFVLKTEKGKSNG